MPMTRILYLVAGLALVASLPLALAPGPAFAIADASGGDQDSKDGDDDSTGGSCTITKRVNVYYPHPPPDGTAFEACSGGSTVVDVDDTGSDDCVGGDGVCYSGPGGPGSDGGDPGDD